MSDEPVLGMKPADVLTDSYLTSYQKDMGRIWDELIRFNSQMYLMGRIFSFPFDLFFPARPQFWNITLWTMYDSCVAISHKLTEDKAKNKLTFVRIRSDVTTSIKCQSLRTRYLDETGSFDHDVLTVNTEVKDVRNNVIAHFSYDLNRRPNLPRLEMPTLDGLRRVGKLQDKLFHQLCFGHARLMVALEYASRSIPVFSKPDEHDIVQILDGEANRSPLLRMPEEQPGFWPTYKENLSSDDLRTLNEYREKFGFPPVR